MTKPCVLVFAGLDPSGGAGIQADIQAISAAGAHPLPIITALTVQDNQHVYAVHPVEPEILREQGRVLIERPTRIDAVKIGIVGSAANATAIAAAIVQLRRLNADLPVVLDPVLASGHGDLLSRGDAVQALAPLRPLATLITPNLPEARALFDPNRASGSKDARGVNGVSDVAAVDAQNKPGGSGQPGWRDEREEVTRQARWLLQQTPHVLIKGGHGDGDTIVNRWFSAGVQRRWQWPRLIGEFHGSGCTLASAIAARLARGVGMEAAIDSAQTYTQRSLAQAFAIAEGQSIPGRVEELR